MIIPLEIIGGRVIANVLVTAPKYRVSYAQVSFLVDTGSSQSFIGMSDAFKMNLPKNRLRFHSHPKIGGSPFEFLELQDVSLVFKDDKDIKISVKPEVLMAAYCTSKKAKAIEEAYAIPSIIGLEFLGEQNWSLHVNVRKSEAHLQQEA